MSVMSELSYDIEQLFIEGLTPTQIATQLNCPIKLVQDWIHEVNCDMEEAFKEEDILDWLDVQIDGRPEPLNGTDEPFSPYVSMNS